ncbi:MAG: tetratricopeptide repeat protein [Planctomycetes bacterium]|nr:tetratricopeptide repeat protein [Planctomycetota bacterium]
MMLSLRLNQALTSAVVIAVTLILSACNPSVSNNSNTPAGNVNDTGTPKDAAAKDAPTKDGAKPEPEPPKEAKYPYQLTAALAKVHLQFNNIDEALRLYELAINTQAKQTGTEDAENWTGLGDALRKANRKAEAEKSYQRALGIYETLFKQNTKPELHNYYIDRIAIHYRVLGNEAEAQKWIAQMKADENNAEQQLALARVLETQNNFEKAEACYKRALELTKADAKQQALVKIGYSGMLQAAKRSDEALKMAKEVVAVKDLPDDTKKAAKTLLFKIYEARGELDKLDFK